MQHNNPSCIDCILRHNALLEPLTARKVLILYEEKEGMIGDAVLKFDHFKVCRYFFPNATITINFPVQSQFPLYSVLLQHNPYLDTLTQLSWPEIIFNDYDVVICVTADEAGLLHHLSERYTRQMQAGEMTTAFFSMSAVMLNQQTGATQTFPLYSQLLDYATRFPGPQYPELFIQETERQWADQWLKQKGLQPHDALIIFVDAASRREKLIRTDVYAQLLTFLLSRENTRVLIYDEKGVGKKLFYQEFLGKQLTNKMIFAEQLGLRKDMSLLAAHQTRMVIGPCTGILHCASGIYNHFVRNGLKKEAIPVLITYTGKYERPFETAQLWWGNAPLVNCLQLRSIHGIPTLMTLLEQDEPARAVTRDLLGCQDYTFDQLSGFINNKLNDPAYGTTLNIFSIR